MAEAGDGQDEIRKRQDKVDQRHREAALAREVATQSAQAMRRPPQQHHLHRKRLGILPGKDLPQEGQTLGDQTEVIATRLSRQL